MTIIYNTLIGSRAVGINKEDSDYDYRSIFVEKTSKLLSLDYQKDQTQSIKDNTDNVSYEIERFLRLAQKANPSILEMLVTDPDKHVIVSTKYSDELRSMFSKLFSPIDALKSFSGYSRQQRAAALRSNATLDDIRKKKFLVALLRTTWNLIELLQTGNFTLKVKEQYRLDILKDIRYNDCYTFYTIDRVFMIVDELLYRAEFEYLPKAIDYRDDKLVNDFLLRIRKENW